MNEMIERAVKALELAQERPKYLLKFCPQSNTWHVEDRITTVFYSYTNYKNAEADYERLNNEWIVRKVIESLKEPTEEIIKNIDAPDMPAGGSIVDIWQDIITAILATK